MNSPALISTGLDKKKFCVLKRTVSLRQFNEMVLLSTHNISFVGEIRKLIFCYTLLTKGLNILFEDRKRKLVKICSTFTVAI